MQVMGKLQVVGTVSLVLTILVGITSIATADNGAGEPKGCLSDAKRFCNGVKPGGLRVLECLARKRSQLSPKCQAEIEPTEAAEIISWRDKCGADIDAKCSEEHLGLGLGACLAKHRKALRPECRFQVGATQTYLAVACGSQVNQLCNSTQPGDGRYLACVDKNESKLTAPCVGVWRWYEGVYQLACTDDIKKYCAGQMAYDKSYPCLQKHLRNLRQGCQAIVEPHQGRQPSASGLGNGPFAGVYATTWGWMACKQADANTNRVGCHYSYQNGRLKCSANKNNKAMTCSWREGATNGRATFVRGAKDHLVGTWGHGQSATSGGPWLAMKR
jgi:hypothetical protein